MFVATGVAGADIISSVEILTEDENGNYTSKQIDIGGCSAVPDLPIATTLATGALFNGLPHLCIGHKEGDPSSKCFGFKTDASWENDFSLMKPLEYGGSSVAFGDWKGVETPWWIVGLIGTEVWGGEPPEEISNGEINLPTEINRPCMTKISDHEAFVTAIPSTESATSNFAWIFNIQFNNWTRIQNTMEKRTHPSCGFLNITSGRFVVLAAGYGSSTTEILNLDTLMWTMGPSTGVDLYGGSMVSVKEDSELILIGGYSTTSLSQILRMNSSMNSWETVGHLNTARYDAVAIAVPLANLPPLCG